MAIKILSNPEELDEPRFKRKVEEIKQSVEIDNISDIMSQHPP